MESTKSKLTKIYKDIEIIERANPNEPEVAKLKKLHGKILSQGGQRFENIVTSKLLEGLCIPYLENVSTTQNYPTHFTGKIKEINNFRLPFKQKT